MSKEHPLRDWRNRQEPRRTLAELADAVGVTASHISEIENWNNEPSLDLASRLQRETGLDIGLFVRPRKKKQPA